MLNTHRMFYGLKTFLLYFIPLVSFYYLTGYFLSKQPNTNNTSGLDLLLMKKYDAQRHQRKGLLKDRFPTDGLGILYNVLVPEVFCKNLIRIGQVGDGGKWICNPTNMLDWPECKIYSLGISNDPSFEEDLQSLLNNTCHVRSVDRDDQTPVTLERIKNINGTFKKAIIGGERNESANTYKFSNILSHFGDARVDILKIDIEGGEYSIVDELISTPICQILIEVHGETPAKTLEFLQTLSRNGFYLFSYEINGFRHDLCEYSFIHESCFKLLNVDVIYGKFLS